MHFIEKLRSSARLLSECLRYEPSVKPSITPTVMPTKVPTGYPTPSPTSDPTSKPSVSPTKNPVSAIPSSSPLCKCRDRRPPDSPTGVWHDSEDVRYSCLLYQRQERECENHGNEFKNYGLTANQACWYHNTAQKRKEIVNFFEHLHVKSERKLLW